MQQNSGAYIILPPPQQAQHRFSSMNVVQTLFMPAGSAAIFLSLLAVPAAAALKLAEQLLILHVARLHACGLPRIFHCLRIIMQAALRQRAEKIPASVSLSGGTLPNALSASA